MKQIRSILIAILILLVASFLAGCGVQAQPRTNSTEALIERVAALETEVADLKAGARVFVGAAAKQPDGTLQTQRITVSRDAHPPM